MAPSAITPPSESFERTTLPSGNAEIFSNNSHYVEPRASPDTTLDLLCIGFGPASLAIAIAMKDNLANGPEKKVLFFEKQPKFAWHAGMQLPGARMQISFLKDLATPRNPRSQFTFINYLFSKGRLNHFINLGTFLPSRLEYEDYLRWCASHFEKEGKVAYGMDVESVQVGEKNAEGKVTSWEVTARDQYGNLIRQKAKHVVIAVGGRAVIPQKLQGLKHVAHSSQFAVSIKQIQQREQGRKPKFVVLGGGQSAAEIYNDLSERFPESEVKLVIKGSSLRPSDDSPFVNEIFDPDRVEGIYNQEPTARAAALALEKGTNYGVVRLELLEHLYDKLYMQRIHNPDPSTWRCNIINNRVMTSAEQAEGGAVKLRFASTESCREGIEEEIKADYVFTATGYRRNAHEEMLEGVRGLVVEREEGKFAVGRDYGVVFGEGAVEEAGIWLQGCNEKTHGLSDTLLSILAVRGGELVSSIFGA
ncbi:hypothetical protein HYALB_00002627 [Hymenoscyphus albidus]|uniref:L-ornithine N(5)-monooxygenase [NAD(P)H] n=1 Tax=Hymenoscyphus albidus TaxID=595503 RepID=A0A9N9LWR3_9HELO|nr:hypothetical protein HYALB_00002627 [Hymenoscyphus albidus]